MYAAFSSGSMSASDAEEESKRQPTVEKASTRFIDVMCS